MGFFFLLVWCVCLYRLFAIPIYYFRLPCICSFFLGSKNVFVRRNSPQTFEAFLFCTPVKLAIHCLPPTLSCRKDPFEMGVAK